MEAVQWERLATIMRRLAEGDRAAVVTLYVEFGRTLSGVVRRHLARLDVVGVIREDLDGLVLDSCFALGDCASGWQSALGVAPWTWAERRIFALVSGWVGQHADELDESALALPAPAPVEPDGVPALDLLRDGRDPMCRLLREAFVEARVSPRDQQLLVETRLQVSLGDPAPAASVAPLYGMTPAAVRQAVKRAKDRLRSLAESEPSYGSLAGMALLT